MLEPTYLLLGSSPIFLINFSLAAAAPVVPPLGIDWYRFKSAFLKSADLFRSVRAIVESFILFSFFKLTGLRWVINLRLSGSFRLLFSGSWDIKELDLGRVEWVCPTTGQFVTSWRVTSDWVPKVVDLSRACFDKTLVRNAARLNFFGSVGDIFLQDGISWNAEISENESRRKSRLQNDEFTESPTIVWRLFIRWVSGGASSGITLANLEIRLFSGWLRKIDLSFRLAKNRSKTVGNYY